jgi:excisionase family DNA binding protein
MRARMRIATVTEVAAFLRLKEETVCSLTSQGKLPGFKLGKSWRFDMDKVERLFAGIPNNGKNRSNGDLENIEVYERSEKV